MANVMGLLSAGPCMALNAGAKCAPPLQSFTQST